MNSNEYFESNKIFIKEIKKCSCQKFDGRSYILNCKINQRGTHEYSFNIDDNYIIKSYSKKALFLTEKSKGQILKAVDDFNLSVEKMKKSSKKYDFDDNKNCIYYSHKLLTTYNFLVEYDNNCFALFENIELDEFIYEFERLCYDASIANIFRNTNRENIDSNPLYKLAVESNDKQLEKQIKLYYQIETKNDCNFLSKLFGVKVLPALPNEFNKNFIVDADTISMTLLRNSGYKILHRPYFAMNGSTHEKWQLNPHTKTGIDAANKDEESIAFCEYVDMIENN